jgi:hypothetical protein
VGWSYHKHGLRANTQSLKYKCRVIHIVSITPLQASCPDWSDWTFGDKFTYSDLNYLRSRDGHAKFVIDVLTNDAFSKGFVIETDGDPDPDRAILNTCRKAAKWARQFGHAIVAFDLITYKLRALSPMELGGARLTVKLDDRKYPISFTYREGTAAEEVIPIANCVIFTNGDNTNAWQGYSELGATIDEYIVKRGWRGAALERARNFSKIVHLLTTPEPVSESDKTEIKKSFPHGDVAVVQGEWNHVLIGGNLEQGELDRVMDDSVGTMAVGAGITKTDMTGAEAGQKLGTDSNQHHYFSEIRAIQDMFILPCKEVYKKFGITVTRFEDAWQMSREQKLQWMIQLLDQLAFHQGNPRIQKLILHQLELLE